VRDMRAPVRLDVPPLSGCDHSVTTARANDARAVLVVIHRPRLTVAWKAARCQHRHVMRFLTLADIAEILNISAAASYALVRSGEIAAIKVGARGQWRIEVTELERYIERQYAEVARSLPATYVEDSSVSDVG